MDSKKYTFPVSLSRFALSAIMSFVRESKRARERARERGAGEIVSRLFLWLVSFHMVPTATVLLILYPFVCADSAINNDYRNKDFSF